MKKLIVFFLCIALAFALIGCGGSSTSEPSAAPAPATAAPPPDPPAVTETSAPEPTETPFADDADDAAATVALVLELKDHPVEELYDLIGEPTGDKTYTSSCLVTGGQDGVLEYDGFTVYTLVMPDGTETVYDCE